MTPEQRAEDTRQLAERELKERLNVRLPVCADRSSGQAKGRLDLGRLRGSAMTAVLAIAAAQDYRREPRSRVDCVEEVGF